MKGKIEGIPLNQEKFRTLTVHNCIFIDSMQMLPASLDVLVENLKNGGHSFPLLWQHPFFPSVKKVALVAEGSLPIRVGHIY